MFFDILESGWRIRKKIKNKLKSNKYGEKVRNRHLFSRTITIHIYV